MEILAAILGSGMNSLLYQALRVEQGLVYHVETFYEKYLGAGLMGIYLECSTKNLEKVLDVTLKQIQLLTSPGLIEKKLPLAKASYKGSLLSDFDRVGGRVRHTALASFLAGSLQSCDDYFCKAEQVQSEEVVRTAERRFTVSQTNLCLRGGVNQNETLEKSLRFLVADHLP
jgi:predicted Zn-dependent peptidase